MPQVNKIWVPVVPDARGFREDVKKTLTAAERTLELAIPLAFDQSKLRENIRIALTGAQAQADRAPVTAQIDVDTAEAQRKIRDLGKDQTATINADADTGKATSQLALASRNRRVQLAIDVNKASLAKAGQAFAAISGARVAGDALKNIGSSLSNLDRAVPVIAGVALAVGSLGSVALSSVSGIVTLGASLAPLAAFAAPLPGLLLAGGAAVGVFAAAMVDAGTQLGSLKPGFAALQDQISSSFWARAKQPILDLVNGTLPSLKSGLSDVASSLGSWSGSVASSFQKAFPADVITGITGKLAESIRNSTTGTDAFAASIAALGTFGAQYLPGIGTAFSNLSMSFNGWIQTVTSNGQLAGWVQEATSVLRQLGEVGANAFGIISGVASAAFAAGGSGLQTLGTALASINTIVNGPAFQGALTTVFEGAAAGASGLAAALGPIGEMFANLAPAISGALAGLGSTAGALLGGIADALNQPAVGAGLEAAISGIAVAVQGLLPALPALGSAFGSIMSVVGTLASVLGPVLGAALSVLAPVLTSVATAIQPLITALGPMLVQTIQLLAPLFTQLGSVLSPIATALLPVISAVFEALSPIITTLVSAIAPLVSAYLPYLSSVLGALMPIIQALGPVISALLPPILQVATLLTQELTVAFQAITPVVSAMVGAIVPVIQSLATIISGVVTVISGLLSGNWAQAWQGAQQIVSGVLSFISAYITSQIGNVRGVISNGIGAVTGIFNNVFGALGGIVRNAMSAVGSAVGGLKSTVLGAISGAGSWLVSVGRNIFEGLISGLKSMGSSILSAVTGPIKDAISGAKSLLGIHSPSRVFREIGEFTGQGMVLGLTSTTPAVHAAINDMAGYVPALPAASTRTSSAAVSGSGASSSAPASVKQENTFNMLDQDPQLVARKFGRELTKAMAGGV